ncbi:prepilin-type N-terminal cleavage/methylation domain-containing protein [Parelusimicrobium proximum]|uniref:type IV pilin protein n=1 Tax=Parelusimicrobium proximum TaxID=3228953 RepID=UPI003D16D8A3
MGNKGFTLIELLVVVLIIAILAAVALPQYAAAVDKARGSEAILMLRAIDDAQKRYYLQNDSWPSAFAQLDIDVPGRDMTCVDGHACKETSNYTYGILGSGLIRAYKTGDSSVGFTYWPDQCPVHSLCGIVTCSANISKKGGIGMCESLGGTDVGLYGDVRYYEIKKFTN